MGNRFTQAPGCVLADAANARPVASENPQIRQDVSRLPGTGPEAERTKAFGAVVHDAICVEVQLSVVELDSV